MLAKELMVKPPITVDRTTPVSEVISLMLLHAVSAIFVTDGEGRVIGVVSEGDLIRRTDTAHENRLQHWLGLLAEGQPLNLEFLKNLRLEQRTAAEVMSMPAITVDESADVAQVSSLLVQHNIKSLPVLSMGKMTGVISRRDILRAVVEQAGKV